MSIMDNVKGKAALQIMAERQGIPMEQAEAEIQAAIDTAWASSDPEAQRLQRQLFPKGKPTPAQFVGIIAKHMR